MSAILSSSLGKYLIGAFLSLGGLSVVLKLCAQYLPSAIHWLVVLFLKQPKVKAYIDKNPDVKKDLIDFINSAAAQADSAIEQS